MPSFSPFVSFVSYTFPLYFCLCTIVSNYGKAFQLIYFRYTYDSKVQLSSFSLGYAHKKMLDYFLINNENENIKLHDLHVLSFIFLVLPLTVHHNIFLTD